MKQDRKVNEFSDSMETALGECSTRAFGRGKCDSLARIVMNVEQILKGADRA